MPPSWWKSSSKEAKKKENKESSVDVLLRKLRFSSDDKGSSRSVDSRGRIIDTHSEIGNISRAHSRSPSPLASRCQSFAERPLAQPLPLPREHLKNIGCNVPVINASTKPKSNRGSKHMMFFPLQVPVCGLSKSGFTDTEDDLATGPVNSDGTSDSDDPSDSHLPSPQASDCDNGTRTNLNSPTSVMQKIQSPSVIHKNSKGMGKPALFNFNDQNLPTSPIRGSGNHLHNIQIPQNRTLFTAPDSSMSSPSRSPMRSYEPEHTINTGFWTGKPYSEVSFLGSGNCSSPGSGHNSVAGDNIAAQLFWQQRSTECSPIPSPRMSSPGPSSRIPSGCVTPTHARSAGVAMESPKSRPDNGKQQSYRLPVPPLTIANTCPFSPTYSAATSPSVPRSPNRTENPTSPAAKWQKGRLLGRGSFGHVYLGFNRESGEMCAMKEVTLFSDDAKSKESAQQLGQEIALLSRLRHPNIVQYYGSETVDDKLYIYLEYVSGGSIYKLLQDYGQFGELAIRSYTQQILSGLAFLHAKSTVHRDIKGANILVDPHGRVKLADFGMAKHITGPACPLSFKGSPYWMAPEVIRNSNGCNLAVDIWSLGCTVLEMATTKPPWSEYAGVPALFKIGNSKELPAIPDHLSEDGKDFVKKCLQRNPFHRPTAAQLLEHPFVKNAAPLAKPIPVSDPSESPSPIITAARSLGIGEGVAVSQARGSNISPGFSDTFARRNMSCPVSPIDTPMLHSRSPQHASGRMSPSPISSPRGTSGASTPLTGGAGAIPFSHQKQPATYLKGCLGTHQRSQHSSYLSGNNFHQIQELGLFQRLPPQMSHVFPDMKSSENGMMGNHYGRILHGEPKDRGDGKLVLADRVSQQLLRDHLTLSSSPNFNPNVSTHDHMNGT